ncbi:MAG: Rne/Rng family ribonuclease [bacterium]|nr:Rne/Rng family ribonuclease [bacterium]
MAKRLLINARHTEECRIAVAEDDRLLELEVEGTEQVQLKGNIYKATITRVEPSLQAAFLDIGSSRNGFLQINDINPTYFKGWPFESEKGGRSRRQQRVPIQDVLEAGQSLVVQVVKDERDAKGATLTTNLSIPGRYLVLMVGSQRGGVSRKINDESQRVRLRQAMSSLLVPPGMGVIVRTAGLNRGTEELQADLDGLLEIWEQIVRGSLEPVTPRILYQESDLAIRTIRDYLRSDFDEVVIDDPETYERARDFITRIMPKMSERILFHSNPAPLFSCYGIDRQVAATDQPEVILPSGGSIVISPTEAVVAIDVNSGRSTGQSDVEETAFNTNKEAAQVIAQQLRLRDLGGLVIIDFIDMADKRHKQIVEKTVRDAVKGDRAKIEVGRISKFGLLEMSRQRLKASLASQSHRKCPACRGRGLTKLPESTALEALRKMEAAVFGGGVRSLRVHMSPAAALFMLNSKRRWLTKLEEDGQAEVVVVPDSRLRADEYELILDTSKHTEATGHVPSAAPRQERTESGRGRPDERRQSFDERQSAGRSSRRRRGGRNRGGQERGGQERSASTHTQDRPVQGAPQIQSPVQQSSSQQSPVAEHAPRVAGPRPESRPESRGEGQGENQRREGGESGRSRNRNRNRRRNRSGGTQEGQGGRALEAGPAAGKPQEGERSSSHVAGSSTAESNTAGPQVAVRPVAVNGGQE